MKEPARGRRRPASAPAGSRRRRGAALVALAAFLPLTASGAAGDVPVLRVERDRLRAPGAGAGGPAGGAGDARSPCPAGVPGPFRIGWVAPDGSRVKQGDVVIRFDPSAIEKRLVDAGDDLEEPGWRWSKQADRRLVRAAQAGEGRGHGPRGAGGRAGSSRRRTR